MSEKDLISEYFDDKLEGFRDVWRVALDVYWLLFALIAGTYIGLLALAGSTLAKVLMVLLPDVLLLFSILLACGMIFYAYTQRAKAFELKKLEASE